MSFVDVHTHVVPSGDDGAQSIEEGLELCCLAAAAGTGTMFATPHMHARFDQYPWSREREQLFEDGFRALRPLAEAIGVRLLRGREVFPTEVANASLESLTLEGTSAVLVEFPGGWLDLDDAVATTWTASAWLSDAGLTPVLAHPERCRDVIADPARLEPFVERGWLLCLNGSSLLGEHGAAVRRTGWEIVERGWSALVASDAHRRDRPPDLSAAYALVGARVGSASASRMFDGSNIPWTGTTALSSAC